MDWYTFVWKRCIGWSKINLVNIFCVSFMHVYVCASAFFCACVCEWIHMQISSSGFEYSVCLHARFITICYSFMWPTTSATDSNKVAFISCYWQLRHFCIFLRSVLCVFVYINLCAVKMLIYIFIAYGALNHSFRWCQSCPVTHFGTFFFC